MPSSALLLPPCKMKISLPCLKLIFAYSAVAAFVPRSAHNDLRPSIQGWPRGPYQNTNQFQLNFRHYSTHWRPALSPLPGRGVPRCLIHGSSGSSRGEESASTDAGQDGGESLESLAKKLADSTFQNVVVLMGAGASVSAGIPDFRSPGTGLYDRLQGYRLPRPEAIFDLDYYRDHPLPFVDLCGSIWPGQAGGPRPTLAHAFCGLLEEKGKLRRIYTQNIDGLESLAGIDTDRLVECHGHFRAASCISCKEAAPIETCREAIIDRVEAPRCSHCGSLVKPDVVFFGEELPKRFQDLVDRDTAECDLLIVMGTSLMVMPVASIPNWVGPTIPRILLNRELVGDFRNTLSRRSRGATGTYSRDVFLEGDCDDGVKKICKLAGWEEMLDERFERCR